MKNKSKIISYTFLCCYMLNVSATPVQHRAETNALHLTQTYRLNTNLPVLLQKHPLNREDKQEPKKVNSEIGVILGRKKKLPKINFLILRTTKNAVLKAVLKRKSYGLRYTRRW
jgi:uncharacterized protein YaaW (UPF0174 family)